MGIGAWWSRKFNTDLLAKFIAVEIVLGFLGGMSIPLLYFCFSYTDYYQVCMIVMIVAIGILTGLEVPLLTRIMEKHYQLKDNLSNVLSLDYFGALIATFVFPFLLLPFVGNFRSSLVFGIVNMSIGFVNLFYFKEKLGKKHSLLFLLWSIAVTLFLVSMLIFSNVVLKFWESGLYSDRIIYTKQSKYQKIVLTKDRNDVRLYLNGNLQFSSVDEYRYHESLIHIPLSKVKSPKQVLLLGAGDGLAVREILKFSEVEKITMVDLDPEVCVLAKSNPFLKELNQGSLDNKKVNLLHLDASKFLEKTPEQFDVIIADLPDPNNPSLARLYSKEFYKLLAKRLKPEGVFVTQATSAYFSKEAYRCIERSVKAGGFDFVFPYHTYVPAFGDWGFVMASHKQMDVAHFDLNKESKFINEEVAKGLFVLEKDLVVEFDKINTLDKPVILDYYLDSWELWK